MKKNVIANVIGKFWSIFSSFLFVPLYIKYLGFESYSIISFTLVISGFMAILDSGLTSTLSREFSRVDKSRSEKIKVFGTLETLFLGVVFTAILILFIFSNFIANNWINLTSYKPEFIAYLLKFVSFEIGFQLLLRFYVGGLLGLEKQIAANLFQILWGVVRNGIVIIAIIFNPTLEMFFAWQTISTIFITFLLSLYLRKILTGKIKFAEFQLNKEVLAEVWKFAAGILLIGFVASINTQLDKLVISKLLRVESLGYYSMAVAISSGIYIIVSAFSAAFQPRFTSLYSAQKRQEAKELFFNINIFVSVIIFTLMSIMIFFASDLIWVWTGKKNLIEKVAYIIPITSLSYAFLSMQIVPFNIAIANGYTKLNTILGIVSLFLTLPGYYILTKRFEVFGAAATFCVVQIVITIFYIKVITKKYKLNENINYFYFKQFILPLLISILLSGICFYISSFLKLERFYMLFFLGASTILVFVGTLIISFSRSGQNNIVNRQVLKQKIKSNFKL